MAEHGFAFSADTFRELAQDALTLAKKGGASACEVNVSEGFGLTASVRRGEVDTLEYNRDKDLSVTVYLGQRSGHASTSDFSPTAMAATVEAALAIARFTAEDPCAGLADRERLATTFPDLQLHHAWALRADEAVELARQTEAAAFAADARITNSEGASVGCQEGHFIFATSEGFMAGYASSRHSISCAVIAGEGEGMQREGWYDCRRAPEDLDSAEHIGREAARRALGRLGARKIATCRAPVLFAAPVALTLMGNFTYAISGGALYRKASFLLDSIGQPIFPAHVQIVDDPGIVRGLGSSAFDNEGVATARRELVRDGVLQGYLLSSYSARKLGMESTGNAGGSHNLLVSGGGGSLAEMARRMGRGLVVTELLGSGVNYVTGDYSRGAAGFWVEEGEIAWPVEEVTIAGNLREMFRNIVAIGDDVLPRSAKRCGSVLIESMKIAGR